MQSLNCGARKRLKHPRVQRRRSAAGGSPSAATLQLDNNASGCDGKRGDNACHSFRDIGAHQLRRNPQNTIPEPTEVTVPLRIRPALQFMSAIINFNYKHGGGRDIIHDVFSDWHLTAKSNSKPLAGKLLPKNALILAEVPPETLRTLRQQRLKLEGLP